MAIKRYKPEHIVTLLRRIEVGIANGKPTPQACNQAEIGKPDASWPGLFLEFETLTNAGMLNAGLTTADLPEILALRLTTPLQGR